MPVLDWPDLGVIDVPEGADMAKVAEAAKRFVRTTKTAPTPQPMTSAQMIGGTGLKAQPLQPAQTLQGAIPPDARLRAQTETDKLRRYRDTIGRMIAPLVGVNFDEMAGDEAKGILRPVRCFEDWDRGRGAGLRARALFRRRSRHGTLLPEESDEKSKRRPRQRYAPRRFDAVCRSKKLR